jgi:hypothetical protein
LSARCKACQNKARRSRNAVNKTVAKWKREKGAPRIKAAKDALRSKGCTICGYDKCMAALHFHHVRGKSASVSSVKTSVSAMKSEACKCIVLCANCHAEVHEGVVSI